MTDDQILIAAEKILARRKMHRRLTNFMEQKTVMIRWDAPNGYKWLGSSSDSITVPMSAVQSIVQAHFDGESK